MGKIYARAIIAGTRTFSSIHAVWKEKTDAALKELCTPEEYKRLIKL